MKLAILLIIISLASCKKSDRSRNCPEFGTIKKGSDLGLMCTEILFIVKTDNTIIQPAIAHHLLDRFSEGDQIRFGYREVFLGMISCGENVKTAELLCVETSDGNSH